MGPYPYEDEVDPDIISPSKHTITAAKGCAFFDAAESFAMIRGGHLDMTFIGGMQVSQKGDLANWKVPGGLIKGMGGAMDLVANTKRVIILMSHTAKDGKSKMVAECSFPLTGLECVDTVITDLGVFDIDGGFVVRELADGVTRYEVEAKTDGRLIF